MLATPPFQQRAPTQQPPAQQPLAQQPPAQRLPGQHPSTGHGAAQSPEADAQLGQSERQKLGERVRLVRGTTEALAAPLTPEDQQIQAFPDASPVKWHRAHTTWFFEQFVLAPHDPGYRLFDPSFVYLFNSYYEAVGPRPARPQRGLLSRPTALTIAAYRAHVDRALQGLIAQAPASLWPTIRDLIELGLNHEQQHQELLVTDILAAFALNPLVPAAQPGWTDPSARQPAHAAPWSEVPGGLYEIGHDGQGFAFDLEGPRHRVFLQPFAIADRLVTNGDFEAFILAGGYQTPTLWLAEGFDRVRAEDWQHPYHWRRGEEAGWNEVTPGGLRPLRPEAPVRFLSFFEADAFARFAGARLPSEAEWEIAAHLNLLSDAYGQVWQWTASPLTAYPGLRLSAGAIGEYNGKFMINQMVLRGSSFATPAGHSRPTYRNFFQPHQRWQAAGLRLARDL